MTHTITRMDLTNRHVVVTGAAAGIGRALAERFHQAGANVVAADLDEAGARHTADALLAIRPGSALAVGADVGTEAGNVALIQAADDQFGYFGRIWTWASSDQRRDPRPTSRSEPSIPRE